MRGIGLVLATAVALAAPTHSAEQVVTPVSTLTLSHLFFQQVVRCWNPPIQPKGGGGTVVQLEIQLDPAGRLIGEPDLKSKFDTSDPATEEAIMRAKAALYACAPYKLPADRYRDWRDIVVTFDPRML